MKNLILIVALLFANFSFAQEVKPKFEKDGDIVKGTYFHDNGLVSQVGFYKDGKLHGEWKSFNAKGKKIAVGNYTQGKKTGKWFFWDGEKLSEVNYSDNQISSIKTWDNNSDVAVNFNK